MEASRKATEATRQLLQPHAGAWARGSSLFPSAHCGRFDRAQRSEQFLKGAQALLASRF